MKKGNTLAVPVGTGRLVAPRYGFNYDCDFHGQELAELLCDQTWPLEAPDSHGESPPEKFKTVNVDGIFYEGWALLKTPSNLTMFVWDKQYRSELLSEKLDYIVSEIRSWRRDGHQFMSEAIFFACNGYLCVQGHTIAELLPRMDAAVRHGMTRLLDLYLQHLTDKYITPLPNLSDFLRGNNDKTNSVPTGAPSPDTATFPLTTEEPNIKHDPQSVYVDELIATTWPPNTPVVLTFQGERLHAPTTTSRSTSPLSEASTLTNNKDNTTKNPNSNPSRQPSPTFSTTSTLSPHLPPAPLPLTATETSDLLTINSNPIFNWLRDYFLHVFASLPAPPATNTINKNVDIAVFVPYKESIDVLDWHIKNRRGVKGGFQKWFGENERKLQDGDAEGVDVQGTGRLGELLARVSPITEEDVEWNGEFVGCVRRYGGIRA